MVVGELVVLKKCYPPLEGSHQEDSGGDWECWDAPLLGSLNVLEINVEEMDVLKKCDSPLDRSHREDSGGDLGC